MKFVSVVLACLMLSACGVGMENEEAAASESASVKSELRNTGPLTSYELCVINCQVHFDATKRSYCLKRCIYAEMPIATPGTVSSSP